MKRQRSIHELGVLRNYPADQVRVKGLLSGGVNPGQGD